MISMETARSPRPALNPRPTLLSPSPVPPCHQLLKQLRPMLLPHKSLSHPFPLVQVPLVLLPCSFHGVLKLPPANFSRSMLMQM